MRAGSDRVNYAEAVAAGRVGGASRRATGFAVTVLCLLLAVRISDVLRNGQPGQVPFTVALFVLPLLYAVPGSRRLLNRHRWPVLAVQAVLTAVPFAVFGGRWQIGIGGLLAGLVLLMMRGRVWWLLAGGLLAAEVTVRAAATGLPYAPAWYGVVGVVTFYVDDALVFFGMVRLAQIIGEVEQARSQAADLAVGRERLRAAEALQAAVGQRLAGIAAQAAAARRALFRDAARAREQIAAAGITAREAVARARAVPAGPPRPEPAAAPAGRAVIGTRLAQAVLVTAVLMFAAANTGDVVVLHFGAWLTAVAIGDIVLIAALQLYHSRPRESRRRPGAWPVTLALQAMLVYAFSFSFTDFSGGLMAPFLAGSILLLIPGWRRWAGYAAVVASSSVLYAALPSRELPVLVGSRLFDALFFAAITAEFGLLVYGLSRLAGLARQLEELHGELARMAAVQERLRVARDVHDLLGLGLSAVALKADLIGALIGRDDARAAAEIGEMGRICAAARADIRLVTGQDRRLSLPAELASAREILASAGIEVRADIPDGPLPAAADEVLAPVLREAVTNVLRHSAARTCLIELTADGGALRLHVANDGATQQPTAGLLTAGGGGRGLANLNARVRSAGGQLASRLAGGRFDLTAEIPPSRGRRPPGGLGRRRRPPLPGPAPGWPAGHR